MNRKIIKNILSFSFANIASKVIVFAFNAIAARYYGSEVFGIYNYAVSVVSYFIMFGNMGIQSYAVYNLSKNPENESTIFSDVVSSELFLGFLSSIALLIYVVIFPVNFQMVLIVGSTILISAVDISWFFQAKQETTIVAKQITVNSILSIVLLVVAVLINNRNMYALPIIISVTQLASYSITWISAFKKSNLEYRFSLINLTINIRKGAPFLFSGIFAAINCNIDVIFLTIMTDNHVVGVYSAIYKIINLIVMIVAYIVAPAFPEMIRLYTAKKNKQLNDLIIKLWKPLLLLIIPVTIGGMILGEKVIIFLFGSDYYGGNTALKLLLFYCLIFYYREIYGYSLTMVGKQSIYMIIVFISCLMNITLNLILIPKFGINGAAFTTVISETVNFILMRFSSKKYINIEFKLSLWKCVIPAAVMGIFTGILNKMNCHIILIITISAIVYFLAVYVTFKNEVKELITQRIRR